MADAARATDSLRTYQGLGPFFFRRPEPRRGWAVSLIVVESEELGLRGSVGVSEGMSESFNWCSFSL